MSPRCHNRKWTRSLSNWRTIIDAASCFLFRLFFPLASADSAELIPLLTTGRCCWSRAIGNRGLHVCSSGGSERLSRLSPPPAVLPLFLADQTGNPGHFLGGWDDPALGREARHFENKLGPDSFLEFFSIFDCHHEGARPADHAVLVIQIEILDIGRRIGWLLHH